MVSPTQLCWRYHSLPLRQRHICVCNLTIIGSDNGLSPGRRQAIIWTNAWILLIGRIGTKFNEILIKLHTFSFKNMQLKTLSAKWWPFCLGLNVLILTEYSSFSTRRINLPFCCEHMRPEQNGCHFADIFMCIFLKGKSSIFIQISLKFVCWGWGIQDSDHQWNNPRLCLISTQFYHLCVCPFPELCQSSSSGGFGFLSQQQILRRLPWS